ncbi:MAG: NAD(P)H-hydrate dehydratase [Candidatus Kapaibacterium sp.]
MIPILNPKEMYSLDNYLINNVGIESKLLMENSAVYSSFKIREILPHYSNILILCGVGNNGGDGLALVRHLMNDYNVSFALIGDSTKQTIDNKYYYETLQTLKLVKIETDEIDFNNYDCIIDSLLGIGGKPPLYEELTDIVIKANSSECIRIAIDTPTGLDSETGIASSPTFNADFTFAMYAEKTGMLLNDGKDYCGTIITLDLGVPLSLISSYSIVQKYDSIRLMKRLNNTSKFDYGKCVVIAGSENMSGAAALTCNSAISTGAGLVYLITTNKPLSLYPEIISFEISNYNTSTLNNSALQQLLDKSDSIVIGPGLDKSDDITNMINSILERYPDKRFIIDADGISALDNKNVYCQNITITPHVGEFANLIGKNRNVILDNLVALAKETAKKMNINILLKGTTTIITDGEDVLLVCDGIPEMATAGSGDVLSGILGAQVNQNLSSNYLQILANATLTHINAAKAALINKNSIIASDIITGLKCIK